MRPGASVLAAAVFLAAAAPLHADEWTLIDVKSPPRHRRPRHRRRDPRHRPRDHRPQHVPHLRPRRRSGDPPHGDDADRTGRRAAPAEGGRHGPGTGRVPLLRSRPRLLLDPAARREGGRAVPLRVRVDRRGDAGVGDRRRPRVARVRRAGALLAVGAGRPRRRRLAARLAGVDDALPLRSRRPAAQPRRARLHGSSRSTTISSTTTRGATSRRPRTSARR